MYNCVLNLKFRPDNDSTIVFLSNTTVLDYVWNPISWTEESKSSGNSVTSEPFEYQGVKLFRAQLWTRVNANLPPYSSLYYEFTLTLLRCPHDNSDFQINQVTYTMQNGSYNCTREKMQEKSKSHNPHLQIFNNTKQFQSLLNEVLNAASHKLCFHIQQKQHKCPECLLKRVQLFASWQD